MCVQDLFSVALAPCSFKVGSKVGRAGQDLLPLCLAFLPVAVQLEDPQRFCGEEPGGPCESSWAARLGWVMGTEGH